MRKISENPLARYPDRRICEAIHPWAVVKVKSRQEKAMADDFFKLGIEYYLPLYTNVTRRKDNGKTRKSICPLFSGYVSFAAPRTTFYDILETGRVSDIIEVKNQRHFISELDQVFMTIERGISLEPYVQTEFPLGSKVIVVSGSLQGISGSIIKLKGKDKIVLTVEALGMATVNVDIRAVKLLE